MAADLACGRDNFIDWAIDVKPRKVLFFSLEMNARQLGHILQPLRERYPEPRLAKNLVIHAKGDPLPLDKEWGQAYFLQMVDEHKPDFVIIDSLTLAAASNVNSDQDMKVLFDFLKVARNHYGFSVVVVHHHRKKANDAQSKKQADTQSDIYGSYIIAQACNFAINLEEIGDDQRNKEISMSLLKLRDAAPVDPFKVVRNDKLHFSRNEVKFNSAMGV
jgi:RecA-family ATPase